jgi:hypothetical protein
MPNIPKILHYCFGYDRSFGGKPWSLVHFVCVKSAVARIRPDRAFIYYEYEPGGVWWQRTLELITAVKIRAPRDVFGNPLQHPAHRADVIRLTTLIEQGGIYLDCDVFVHENFDHLLDSSVVLGKQGANGELGLGNAVVLAEPGAPFLKKWYDEYRWFRSKGFDRHWDEHSVRVPLALSRSFPNQLTILPHNAFYWPLWMPSHLDMIYGSPSESATRSTLANHLWESAAWESYLENLTPAKVREVDSNFHQWARVYVDDFPDEYGMPNMMSRLKRSFMHQKRRLFRA